MLMIIPKEDQYNGLFKVTLPATKAMNIGLKHGPQVLNYNLRDVNVDISKNSKSTLTHLARKCGVSSKLKKAELVLELKNCIKFE